MPLHDEEKKGLKRKLNNYKVVLIVFLTFGIIIAIGGTVIGAITSEDGIIMGIFDSYVTNILFIICIIILVRQLKSSKFNIDNYQAVIAECINRYSTDEHTYVIYKDSLGNRYVVNEAKAYRNVYKNDVSRLIVNMNEKREKDLLDRKSKNIPAYYLSISQKFIGEYKYEDI